jgi:hypothetical protein
VIIRPRSPPGRRNRCGRRPGVLDEHQVLGVVVDVFEGLYHVVVAANATVEAGPGVFGCDEHQVLRVVVDVVEQLSPVVAAAVGADVDFLHQEVVLVVAFVVHRVLLRVVVDTVDGLLGEVAWRSQQRLSGVGPERDLVLMGERPKARVSLAEAGVSPRSVRRLEVEDRRRVDKVLGRRWVRCQLGQRVRRLEQFEGRVLGPRWVL